MNWLIILATVVVFGAQVNEAMQEEITREPSDGVRPRLEQHQTPTGSVREDRSIPSPPESPPEGIYSFVLRGWSLKGLLGHMWLHGGIFHLLGNMWFLWIFGNAVCAKVGNIAYLPLYAALGVAAGITHLLGSSAGILGASGAINGIVGMYLVLFPLNDITCYWLFFVYVRQFTVSSFWMIIFWAVWNNVIGLFLGDPDIAYYAHLGGFAAGFAAAFLMCKQGWIKMERYEKSLVQMWQEWRQGGPSPAYDPVLAQAGFRPTDEEPPQAEADRPIPLPPPTRPSVPLRDLNDVMPRATAAAPILVQCSCGRTIRASLRYEGKLVRCPGCQGTVRIPRNGEPANVQEPAAESLMSDEPHPADDCIRFSCRCGQAIKVPGNHAGHFGVCPQCGARLQVPKIS
jgi:membrane associated rhomboid family serine protease